MYWLGGNTPDGKKKKIYSNEKEDYIQLDPDITNRINCIVANIYFSGSAIGFKKRGYPGIDSKFIIEPKFTQSIIFTAQGCSRY